MITTSTETDKIFAALVSAKKEFGPVVKLSFNPHFKNWFADIASINSATSQALHKNGLAVIQQVASAEGGVSIGCMLVHESGQWLQVEPAFFPATKQDAQGSGSATTYGRRYQLSALLCLSAEDDDDGNGASKPGKESAAAVAARLKEAKQGGDDDFL
jgi:hypothetical protein